MVSDLVKRYPKGTANAVDGVSFAVAPGEVFGLLGPNGAGKTTTVGVLTTRVRPTSGRARVAGVDVVDDPVGARARLAVVPQRNNLDRSLTIRDNLVFHAHYHGVPAEQRGRRADEQIERFGLSERANEKPDRFSGGQEQRVMIARALMHRPQVLFLDEPSTGLDPAARLFVWDRVREMRDDGLTVVMTTHSMDEAAALSDTVGIMDRGTLLALDSPETLTRSLPGSRTLDVTAAADGADRDALLAELAALDRVQRADDVGGESGRVQVRLSVDDDAAGLVAPVAAVVARHGAELTDVSLGRPSLEDVFIHLTGRALR